MGKHIPGKSQPTEARVVVLISERKKKLKASSILIGIKKVTTEVKKNSSRRT